MKRTSIFLTPELEARLDAEAARTGIKVSALIRRCIDSVIPPVESSPGELRSRIDRAGLLKVFVLDARSGRLLVEPGDGMDGMFEPLAQIWVPSNMVTFGETAESISGSLVNRRSTETPPDLRLNLMAAPPKKSDPADLLRMNVQSTDEPESASVAESSPAPIPTRCGICKELFPSKAAKKRHVRDAHSTSPTTGEVSKS